MHEKLYLKWQHNALHFLNISQDDITCGWCYFRQNFLCILIKEIKLWVSVFMREKGFFPVFVLEASKWQIYFLVRQRVYHYLSTTNTSHFSYNSQKTQLLKIVGFRKEMLSQAMKKGHN